MEQKTNMGKELLKHLSHPQIDKAALKSYVSHLENAGDGRFKFERIWWKGIPFPDILKVQTRIPIKNLAEIQKLLGKDVKSIEIFPIGIPNPEELQAIVNIPIVHNPNNEKIPGR